MGSWAAAPYCPLLPACWYDDDDPRALPRSPRSPRSSLSSLRLRRSLEPERERLRGWKDGRTDGGGREVWVGRWAKAVANGAVFGRKDESKYRAGGGRMHKGRAKGGRGEGERKGQATRTASARVRQLWADLLSLLLRLRLRLRERERERERRRRSRRRDRLRLRLRLRHRGIGKATRDVCQERVSA